jgi:hypothetical protein
MDYAAARRRLPPPQFLRQTVRIVQDDGAATINR